MAIMNLENAAVYCVFVDRGAILLGYWFWRVSSLEQRNKLFNATPIAHYLSYLSSKSSEDSYPSDFQLLFDKPAKLTPFFVKISKDEHLPLLLSR